MQVKVFTTEVCPKCRRLKSFLNANGILYETVDMQSPEGMTELLENQVFLYDAPVLQAGEKFYASKQLFVGNEVNIAAVIAAAQGTLVPFLGKTSPI